MITQATLTPSGEHQGNENGTINTGEVGEEIFESVPSQMEVRRGKAPSRRNQRINMGR